LERAPSAVALHPLPPLAALYLALPTVVLFFPRRVCGHWRVTRTLFIHSHGGMGGEEGLLLSPMNDEMPDTPVLALSGFLRWAPSERNPKASAYIDYLTSGPACFRGRKIADKSGNLFHFSNAIKYGYIFHCFSYA
jgi:hypothetical protein